jgi:leucyl-tRNA synthetase
MTIADLVLDTVAKFLHKDMFGKTEADAHIQPSQMTDAVWDYVFCRTEAVDSDIPQATLEAMRREFSYWYPLDVSLPNLQRFFETPRYCIFILVNLTPIQGSH